MIAQGIKSTWRIAQTMRVLTETGVEWLLGDRPPTPRLMRKTFERLGATYIKLGQFIASSPSFFPADYVEEFQACLDRTTPLPFSTLEKTLKREFKQPLQRIFSDIDKTPLASASIAQVHAARLVNGEDVVIKIQKPGVQDILITDLNFLYVSARLLELIKPDLSWASLSAIVAEIQRTMMEECDFLKEAEHIKQFADFLHRTHNTQALVPRVYRHATTKRVLTMERFYGVPLTDLAGIRRYSENPEATLITAMNTWFASLLFCDFFHADVHAGNLLVLEDGRIGFIDFGIVGRIAPATWTAMNALLDAIPKSDYLTIAKALVTIGITKQEIDVSRFAKDLEAVFARLNQLHTASAQEPILLDEKHINRLLFDMVAVGQRYGLHFPREFALLLKQFLYFDRYVHLLAPNVNIYDDVRLQRMALD